MISYIAATVFHYIYLKSDRDLDEERYMHFPSAFTHTDNKLKFFPTRLIED